MAHLGKYQVIPDRELKHFWLWALILFLWFLQANHVCALGAIIQCEFHMYPDRDSDN